MPVSALSSEFCTVQALVGPKYLSALPNSEVSVCQGYNVRLLMGMESVPEQDVG